MGQSASKVASRWAAAKTKPPPHIPSIPGKGGSGAPPADPLTGFSRGAGLRTHQEDVQRQFLQAQQQKGANNHNNSSGDSTYKDKLPDDLIKFMTDVGPLTRKGETTQRRRRLPRTNAAASVDEDASSGQSPAADKTRRTENMRLAENIAGFETSRTTSFSHKHEVVDPKDAGLDVVQIYSLLAGRSTMDSYCPPSLDEKDRQVQLRLLEQLIQYTQLPVLLRDTDDTYVGAWPEKAQDLQQEYRGMTRLSTNSAKLVLEDLWENRAGHQQS